MFKKFTEAAGRLREAISPSSVEVNKVSQEIDAGRRHFGKMLLGAAAVTAISSPAMAAFKSVEEILQAEESSNEFMKRIEFVDRESVDKMKEAIAQFVIIEKQEDGSNLVRMNEDSKMFKYFKNTPAELDTSTGETWLYTQEFGVAFGEYLTENLDATVTTIKFNGLNEISERTVPVLEAIEASLEVARLDGNAKTTEVVKNTIANLYAEITKSHTIRASYAKRNNEPKVMNTSFQEAEKYAQKLLKAPKDQVYVSDSKKSVAHKSRVAFGLMEGDDSFARESIRLAQKDMSIQIALNYGTAPLNHLWHAAKIDRGFDDLQHIALLKICDDIAKNFHCTKGLEPYYEEVVKEEERLRADILKYTGGKKALLSDVQLATCKAKAACYGTEGDFAFLSIEGDPKIPKDMGGNIFGMKEQNIVRFNIDTYSGKKMGNPQSYASIGEYLEEDIQDRASLYGGDRLYLLTDLTPNDIDNLDKVFKARIGIDEILKEKSAVNLFA